MAGAIDDEGPGKWNAALPLVGAVGRDIQLHARDHVRIVAVWSEAFLRHRVENSVPLDRRGADVRKQRKRDAVLLAERAKNILRIVADTDQAESILAQRVVPALQLEQLRFAVGTPVGGAVEDDHRAFGSHHRLQCPFRPMLIGKVEVRNRLTDLWTKLRNVTLPDLLRPSADDEHSGHRERSNGTTIDTSHRNLPARND